MHFKVYHNVAQDYFERPLGMMDGYAPEHPITLVAIFDSLESNSVMDALERIYFLFNVGDDPDFGAPDPAAQLYRFRGNRSLSVGDVVQADNRWFAVGSFGWDEIEKPPIIGNQPRAGTNPLTD